MRHATRDRLAAIKLGIRPTIQDFIASRLRPRGYACPEEVDLCSRTTTVLQDGLCLPFSIVHEFDVVIDPCSPFPFHAALASSCDKFLHAKMSVLPIQPSDTQWKI
jgi:hypothetical protein